MSEHPEHQSKQEGMREALEEILTHSESALTCDLPSTESMNIEAAFEQIREIASAALSDVTEQKQILSDCPEPLGQTREDEGRDAQ